MLKKQKKAESANKKIIVSTKKLEEDTRDILQGVSSGVLSEEFKKLGNSKWNTWILITSLLIVVFGVVVLIIQSYQLTDYLIKAFEKGYFDYKIFIAKWSVTVPYLLVTSFAYIELRNRIRLRDQYMFRESVASSLNGYTEVLLNRVNDIEKTDERSGARRTVIEFIIESMLELTKSPINSKDKQSMGVKIRDIGEASFTNDH